MYPILFEFGFITIFSLWLFVAIGFVVAAATLVNLAKKMRVKLNHVADHSWVLFLMTVGFSRATFILTHTDLYFYQFSWSSFWGLFALWDKGFSFWGALLALGVGIYFLFKKEKTEALHILDILVPSLAFGVMVGDIGAFLEGINYGTPTDIPWAVTFRNANVKYIAPVHPTQMYSALYALGMGSLTMHLLKKLRGRAPGLVANLGICLYSFFKFLEEFVRGDETLKIFSFRVPQLLALAIFLIAGYLLFKRFRNTPDRHLLLNISKKPPRPNSSESSANRTTLQNQAA